MPKIFLDVTIDTTNTFTVGEGLVRVGAVILGIVVLYVFGKSMLNAIAKGTGKVRNKLSNRMADVNFKFQQYVYLHHKSPLSKLYNWVNSQLIASNLKRHGLTPSGYILFWAFIAALASVLVRILLGGNLMWMIGLTIGFFIMSMILTRVFISSAMETREIAVMNAIDLIVPEISNGVKNAIAQYINNFDPLVQSDFQEFLINIQDRGFSFENSMMILSDNLGPIFRDFAQKAIYFESSGEKMQEVFSDIVETNRLRRQIREDNETKFHDLKVQFVVSTLLCAGYFCFIMITDDFSRHFFLETTGGTILLVVIVTTIFLVLSYITTIKSRAL